MTQEKNIARSTRRMHKDAAPRVALGAGVGSNPKSKTIFDLVWDLMTREVEVCLSSVCICVCMCVCVWMFPLVFLSRPRSFRVAGCARGPTSPEMIVFTPSSCCSCDLSFAADRDRLRQMLSKSDEEVADLRSQLQKASFCAIRGFYKSACGWERLSVARFSGEKRHHTLAPARPLGSMLFEATPSEVFQ